MTPAAEPILVSGAAGFIGFSLACRLLKPDGRSTLQNADARGA